MLTRDDRTLPDAQSIWEDVASVGVTHVGCKDVGLPEPQLASFLSAARAAGHTTYLEVVSETPEDELRSAEVALRVAPDYLIGGTQVEPVMRLIAGSGMKYFPYVGRIVGHPCLLRGSIDEICEDARRVEQQGADGINLLAYRYDGDVPALVEAVSNATRLPLICAGSVDSTQRDRRARRARGLGVHGRYRGARRALRRGRVAGRPADRDPRRRGRPLHRRQLIRRT